MATKMRTSSTRPALLPVQAASTLGPAAPSSPSSARTSARGCRPELAAAVAPLGRVPGEQAHKEERGELVAVALFI